LNRSQAKETLLLYRPGSAHNQAEEFAEALELLKTDPDLARWFKEHCELQEAIGAKFNQILVPDGLKEQIISERSKPPVSERIPNRHAVLVMMAAGIVLVLGLVAFFQRPPHEDYSFSNFRYRMAGAMLRQYPKMDLATNDMRQIRQYLDEKQAHGDYVLPKGLTRVTSTGCAVLSWKGKTVSMICFNSGKNGKPTEPDLFFFIVDRSAVENAPASAVPTLSPFSEMTTASWSVGDKTYLLTGSGDETFLKPFVESTTN
jgi:hypothetical protein